MRSLLLGLSLAALMFMQTGCSIGYYIHTSTNHLGLMAKRKKISKIIKDPSVSEKTKERLELALDVKQFLHKSLKLKNDKNYLTYVDIKGPYVTYVVRAAPWNKLENYYWKFPIVGKMPYKGYYKEKLAIKESKKFDPDEYDIYVRGASAYSTLGWFKDPILSSMLNMPLQDYVNVLIHETIHANLYIKSNTDFNERAAVFLSSAATLLFFKNRNPDNKEIIKLIEDEDHDLELFSKFLSLTLSELETWYKENDITKDLKEKKLTSIKLKYKDTVTPYLKTDSYRFFSELDLNNAKLLSYKTYLSDLSDFKKLYIQNDSNFELTMKALKSIEGSKSPLEDLKKLIAR